MATLSPNQCRFLLENIDLSLLFPGGEIVTFEEHGQISVGLKLNSNANRNHILKAASLLMIWQRRLIQWNGKYQKDFHRPDFMQSLNIENSDNKISYNKLYKRINLMMLNIVKSYVLFIEILKSCNFKTLKDFSDWIEIHGEDTVAYADQEIHLKQIMNYYNMAYEIIVDLTSDPNYAAEMLALGIQAERNGKTPFLEGKPISLVNVKNSLERWRRVTKIVPDQSLQEERKDEPIPPIFINWGTASKMQWGHPKKKFYENEMEIPFDINAFIDPYKIISA